MKIRPLGAELFRADGQTDVTKVIVTFRNFANASRKDSSNHIIFLQWLGIFPLLQYTLVRNVSETVSILLYWFYGGQFVSRVVGVSSPEDTKYVLNAVWC